MLLLLLVAFGDMLGMVPFIFKSLAAPKSLVGAVAAVIAVAVVVADVFAAMLLVVAIFGPPLVSFGAPVDIICMLA